MGLKYATITGVTRDDLEDEGAWLYAETIRQVHQLKMLLLCLPNTRKYLDMLLLGTQCEDLQI